MNLWRRIIKQTKEERAQKKKEWRLANPDKVREHNRRGNEKRRKGRRIATEEELLQREFDRKRKDKEYFQANKEWLQQNRTKYYRNNKWAQRLRGIKSRSKQFDIPFDLDLTDIQVPEFCPVLGIKLDDFVIDTRGGHWNSPSVDRIVPELGYVKGNVRIISKRANVLKNNMTPEEASLIYKDVLKCHAGKKQE